MERNCSEITEMQTKVRENSEDEPLPDGRVLFTDGSSRVVDGKRISGYAVIDGQNMRTEQKGKLTLRLVCSVLWNLCTEKRKRTEEPFILIRSMHSGLSTHLGKIGRKRVPEF